MGVAVLICPWQASYYHQVEDPPQLVEVPPPKKTVGKPLRQTMGRGKSTEHPLKIVENYTEHPWKINNEHRPDENYGKLYGTSMEQLLEKSMEPSDTLRFYGLTMLQAQI